mmetsp:Transcript_3701/g.6306  ORF Transcript_3701/g.6306 Transcript_3701/m.6306 type:complete len:223 (-) Transcript_3701:21-689(-)
MQKRFEVRVFSQEELELIASGFKNQLNEIREAIKSVDIMLKKSKFEMRQVTLQNYKRGLCNDLVTKGTRQIEIIQSCCLDVTGAPIPTIFFKKLTADIYRYLADQQGQTNRTLFKEKALVTYKESVYMLKCLRELRVQQNKPDPIDNLRLSLFLNYAIFLWELMHEKKQAIRILKREIAEALDDFDKWDQNQIEQIKQQVELIQENINLWKEQVDTDSEEEN